MYVLGREIIIFFYNHLLIESTGRGWINNNEVADLPGNTLAKLTYFGIGSNVQSIAHDKIFPRTRRAVVCQTRISADVLPAKLGSDFAHHTLDYASTLDHV